MEIIKYGKIIYGSLDWDHSNVHIPYLLLHPLNDPTHKEMIRANATDKHESISLDHLNREWWVSVAQMKRRKYHDRKSWGATFNMHSIKQPVRYLWK